MDKKVLILVLVGIIIAIIGGFFAVNELNGNDFSKNMREAGDANAEEIIFEMDLNKSLNNQSKKEIEKNINLTKQSIPLLEKIDVSLNKALESTDNETIKDYLRFAIRLNQFSLNETKNKQIILEANQDYLYNKNISASEYYEIYYEYRKNYDIYIENSKNITKDIEKLLKNNPDFVEELKSHGFGGGLYLGEFI